MLTPQQVAQAKATTQTGGVSPNGSMTPEQARAWVNGTPSPTTSTPSRSTVADVGIGATKAATNILSQGDLLGTMQRLSKGDTSDLNKEKLLQIFKLPDVLDTMNRMAGAKTDWTGKPDAPQSVSQTPDFTGQTPTQRADVLTPTNEAQKVGEVGVNTAAQLAPFAGAMGETIKPALEKVGTKIKEAMTPDVAVQDAAKQKETDQYVSSQYTKAIKPTIAGKTNPGQIERYNANVGKAISTIVENKPTLALVDQYGEPTGKLPQTIDEFRQAIDQSKSVIFKKYDAMSKSAGETGAVVDLKPAAGELQKIATNKIVLDLHPDLAAYAAAKADTLLKRGTYTTEEAQTAVQNLNKSLDAYYRNPSYETASRASVDALIANQLRSGLDTSIEKAGQEGYGDLKGKYAALKAIEKDVTKRGIVEARQTGGRGLNVGDVISAEELVRGLATMNPQAIATAGAIKGIQALRKWYTDPNRAIKLMFEKAESTTQSASSPQIPPQSPPAK